MRFWAKVEEAQSGCWEWRGATNGRYSTVGWGGHQQWVYGHRLVYEMLVRPIPAGLVIDHLCRNPLCVNPAHLEAVTQAENIRRGKGDVCPHGHPRTPENIYWYRGKRLCRACRIRHQLEHAERTRPGKRSFPRGDDGRADRSVCIRGHPLEGDNLGIDDGRRYCRTCKRAGARRRYARRKKTEDAA